MSNESDSLTASQHDSVHPLTGWELIVYLDEYCKTRHPDALAALATISSGVDRITRLALFFDTARGILAAQHNPGAAAVPKPIKPPSTKPGFRR